MSTEPIDPAAVMAAHQAMQPFGSCGGYDCSLAGVEWPCEPFRLAEALAAEQGKVERFQALARCSCGAERFRRRSGSTEPAKHRMYCREYVGPLTHTWASGPQWNGTFGGWDYTCSCGGWFRQGGAAGHGDGTDEAVPVCPRADQTVSAA